jgi:hypothetical protein
MLPRVDDMLPPGPILVTRSATLAVTLLGMVKEKSREIRVRRIAERQGLRLVKSRRRDPLATDYGYTLVNTRNRAVPGRRDLDAIEAYLRDESRLQPKPRKVSTPRPTGLRTP